MELFLNEWFVEMRSKDSSIDGDTIKSKARDIYMDIHPFGPSREEPLNNLGHPEYFFKYNFYKFFHIIPIFLTNFDIWPSALK